jgi:cyclohexyl-isocyanide hydratase
MRIAFVVYDGMTALDFVGVYDPVTRLGTMGFRDDVRWEVCARTDECVATGGLPIGPTSVDPSLDAFDAVVVPGGVGMALPDADDPLVEWLRPAADCDLVASVCTGALLLAAADLLGDRPGATHPSAREALREVTTISEARVVDVGDVVTAGGVTAAIDLGLHLVERFADAETRRRIAEQTDYPFDVAAQESESAP